MIAFSLIELAQKLAEEESLVAALRRDLATVTEQRDELCDRVADDAFVIDAVFDKMAALCAWEDDNADTAGDLTEATNRLDRALVERARKYPRGVQ